MIVYTDEQGTDEWLAARRGVITGSRFKDCRDRTAKGQPSAACLSYAYDIARERCGGSAPSKFQTPAMRTGTEQEPIARMAYETETGLLVETAGFVTDDDGLFGASVDGLVGEHGIIEIKTMVSSATLFKAVVMEDFSEYRDQCVGEMWLLGRLWVDLVLWAPDLPKQIYIHRIHRDDDEIQALEDDLLKFAKLVKTYQEQLGQRLAA